MVEVVVAVAAAVLIFAFGTFVLRSLATPPPPPPPEGELRRIKMVYRCASCGFEIRAMLAPSEDPDPPRHCMDEMELVKRAEDFL